MNGAVGELVVTQTPQGPQPIHVEPPLEAGARVVKHPLSPSRPHQLDRLGAVLVQDDEGGMVQQLRVRVRGGFEAREGR